MSLTVKEFKMWLQGVEEMQDEGWTPSSAQWGKIRTKIHELDDPSLSSAQVHQPPMQMHRSAGPVQLPLSADDGLSGDFALPVITDSLETMDIPLDQMNRSGLKPTIKPPAVPSSSARMASTSSSSIPPHTPSDTSGKPYASPFA